MNILIACDYFLDYLGGAQTAIAAEAAALRAAGHQVILVAPARRGTARGQYPFRSPIVLPGLDMAVVANSHATRRRLADIVRRERIDVVHVHSEFGLAAAALQIASEAGIPFVHTVHTFYWRSGMRSSRAIGWLIRALHARATGLHSAGVRLCANEIDNAMRGLTLSMARRADVVVSPSAHQARDLLAAGVTSVEAVPNCVETVPNGVPATKRRAPAPITAVTGPLRVLWIGRCIPEKRAAEFAEAAALAIEILGPGRLEVTFAGCGPLLAKMRRITRAAPGIAVVGRVAYDRITDLLSSHHVSALSSLGYDNQPMTVAESMTALRGVLFVDGRLREGLSQAGILIDDSTVEGMAAALVELAWDPQPVIDASALAVTARAVFDPTVHAATLEAIYSAAAAMPAATVARRAAVLV